MRQGNGFESPSKNAPGAEQHTGSPESTLAGEVARLRKDLQTAYEKAQLRGAAMRLDIAELRSRLNRRLSVLVPLVDLMLVEAEERELPLGVREDLATLQRHLECLCRAAEVVVPVDEPDRRGQFDLNGYRADP
jgi:hypothetical protein